MELDNGEHVNQQNSDFVADRITKPVDDSNVDTIVDSALKINTDPSKQRHFLAAFFFSFIFGVFGADRFYLGKIWTGLLKLLTFGGFGIWAFVDLMQIMSGVMRDKQGNKLLDADKYKKLARRTIFIFVLTSFLIIVILVFLTYYAFSQIIDSGFLETYYQVLQSGDIDQLKKYY